MTEKKAPYNLDGNLILALDASTTAIGWCYAQGDSYISSDTYKPHGSDAWLRIVDIGMWLSNTLYRFTPQVVVAEESCGDRGNRRTDRLLGAVLGVIFYCVRIHTQAEFCFVNPQSVKATGFCKDTPMETSLLIGKKISRDEADAVGVWQTYLAKSRSQGGLAAAR